MTERQRNVVDMLAGSPRPVTRLALDRDEIEFLDELALEGLVFRGYDRKGIGQYSADQSVMVELLEDDFIVERAVRSTHGRA